MLADNQWLQAVIAVAATITAVGIIWRKVIRPLIHGAAEFAKSAQTLADIADQFRPNHGSSLVDRLAKIDGEVREVRTMSETALEQHQQLAERLREILRWLEGDR